MSYVSLAFIHWPYLETIFVVLPRHLSDLGCNKTPTFNACARALRPRAYAQVYIGSSCNWCTSHSRRRLLVVLFAYTPLFTLNQSAPQRCSCRWCCSPRSRSRFAFARRSNALPVRPTCATRTHPSRNCLISRITTDDRTSTLDCREDYRRRRRSCHCCCWSMFDS